MVDSSSGKKHFFIDILWSALATRFKKIFNSTQVDLFLEILSRLQLRKGTISTDSNSDQYPQWPPTMVRNEHALLSMTLLQLRQRYRSRP